MTRLAIYGAALVAFAAATVMTVASIVTPRWISYSPTTSTSHLWRDIGLHRSCSSRSRPHCYQYPLDDMCEGQERYFCSMWRSTGFLMSFATIFELSTIVSFFVVMLGGKCKRKGGWPMLVALQVTVAAIQYSCLSIVAYLFSNDDQFAGPGWSLSTSWGLCGVSATVALVCAIAMTIFAYTLPPEDDYEDLDDGDSNILSYDEAAYRLSQERLRDWALYR